MRVKGGIALVVGFLAMIAAGMVMAGAFDAEKRAGLVGETDRGYVGIVSDQANAQLRRSVDEINLKRKEEYRAIAKKRNTKLGTVEQVFGEQLLKRAGSGEFIQINGAWQQKP